MSAPSPAKIIDLANAFYQSQTLFAASDAGVFGFLAQSPGASLHAVAAGLHLDPRGCRLLLDACVAVGLLVKAADETYRNSPEAAAFLVPGAPGDLSKAIRYNRDVYAAWGKTGEFVRTGNPVERPEIHLGDDAARTRAFVLSMHGRALGIGRAVAPLLHLESCRTLLDVGGGPGTYACLIARCNPQLRCITIDLPAVSAIASELIAQAGLSDRVEARPGNYREAAFPGGMDAVIFFGVLHQESPESIQALFRKAYASLNPGGTVYVMDMMTDATRCAPAFSALFALNMALTTENGWVFSDCDLRQWLEGAGFADFRVSPLNPPMPHWLAQATRPRA